MKSGHRWPSPDFLSSLIDIIPMKRLTRFAHRFLTVAQGKEKSALQKAEAEYVCIPRVPNSVRLFRNVDPDGYTTKQISTQSVAGRPRIFAYTVSMFHGPTSTVNPFVVTCKGCHQNIPAPVETLPSSWIIAACPLCKQRRRYLPTEIFQGKLSHQLSQPTGEERHPNR
jgi:hypothetical protein